MIPELLERLRALPGDTRTALSFFSRLPVATPGVSFSLDRAAGAWPAAGFVIALGPALLYWAMVASGIFSGGIPIYVALALLIALTGAMHEDGLADTVDGLGGGRSREGRLAIMRDSRIGTYGVLALVVMFAVRAGGLSSIPFPGYPAGALALVMVAVLSRSLALWHWADTASARSDGMAWAAGQPDRPSLLVGAILGGVAVLVLLFAFRLSAVFGILLAVLGVALFTQLCRRLIGGHTGDTIGAAQQIAETLLFVGLATSWRLYVDWTGVLA